MSPQKFIPGRALILPLIFFIFACNSQQHQAFTPTLPPSTATRIPPPGPTRDIATAIPPIPTAAITLTPAVYPEWVRDFSDPILAGLAGRRPDFQDEFELLNLGWFYETSAGPYTRYYSDISDGSLSLQLPNAVDKKEAYAYNPALASRNIVIEIDLRFEATQPGDVFRLAYKPSAGQDALVDLSKDETWVFRWYMNGDWKSTEGSFDQFPPQEIGIRFISHEGNCAVYLDDTPLGYSNSCMDTSITGKVLRDAISLRLISDGTHPAEVQINRVLFWDLDAPAYFPAHP